MAQDAAAIVLPPLTWAPSPNFSSRRGVRVDLLVLHETAGSYAGAVRWLRTPTVYNADGSVKSGPNASATLVLNEHATEASQLVRLRDKPWTQAHYNPRAVSLELANITAKGFHDEHQLRVAARIFGWLTLELELPPRWARGGVGRGYCYHGELGALGGGHFQCGPTLPAWHRFLGYVHDELERGHFRKAWAR